MTISEASILLVDDEPDFLEIYTAWLTDAGCKNISSTHDSEHAFAILCDRSFDLLISDINMPKMDGTVMLRRLSKICRVPNTIFASGFETPDSRELHHLGVNAFLSKPMRRKDLLSAAQNALEHRRKCWVNVMLIEPIQSIFLTRDENCRLEILRPILLGRGGFMAHYSGPLTLGAVSFRCELPGDEGELKGQGYIRWHSKTEQRIGIEFAYIEPASRPWVVNGIATAQPQCFIPGIV